LTGGDDHFIVYKVFAYLVTVVLYRKYSPFIIIYVHAAAVLDGKLSNRKYSSDWGFLILARMKNLSFLLSSLRRFNKEVLSYQTLFL